MIKLMTELERRYWTWLEENDPGEIYSLDQLFYAIREEYPHCKDEAKATLEALAMKQEDEHSLPPLLIHRYASEPLYQFFDETVPHDDICLGLGHKAVAPLAKFMGDKLDPMPSLLDAYCEQA